MHAEVAAYITGHAHEVDENGSRLVVRNGYHDERAVLKAAGAVMVRAPRVNDKRVDSESGARQRFHAALGKHSDQCRGDSRRGVVGAQAAAHARAAPPRRRAAAAAASRNKRARAHQLMGIDQRAVDGETVHVKGG